MVYYRPLDTEESVDDDLPMAETDLFISYRIIDRIKSNAWDSPRRAAAIALLQSEVTEANIQLLSRCIGETPVNLVYIRPSSGVGCACDHLSSPGQPRWRLARPHHAIVVYVPHFDPAYLPRGEYIVHDLDPRRILSSADLDAFRLMFSRACGARIWLSGAVEVLYQTEKELLRDRREGVARNAVFRDVVVDVMDCIPSKEVLHRSTIPRLAVPSRVPPRSLVCFTSPYRKKTSQNGKRARATTHCWLGKGHRSPRGAPLFVSSTVQFHDKRTRERQGYVIHKADRELLKHEMSTAKAEGMQHAWGAGSFSQTASLLWRCVPDPNEIAKNAPEDVKDAMQRAIGDLSGFSGSMLCLGKPTDKTAKALVFRNFQLSGQIGGTDETKRKLSNIKGGFLPPSFVYDNCALDIGASGVDPEAGKFHTARRMQLPESTNQRNFTGPK